MIPAVHISLPVTDLKASVGFYRRFLGADPVKEREDYAKFRLTDPPLNLALNEVPGAVGQTAGHLGIEVSSSSEVWRRRGGVQEAGLVTRTEEGVDCCYAVQDKFWVTDPDGARWEVFTVTDDAGQAAGAATCCAPGCCA